MLRSRASALLLLTSLLCICSSSGFAQSTDRSQLLSQIKSLRGEIREKEELLLAPSAEDQKAFAEFLARPHTGLVRLLPREKYDGILTTRGGGSYYSFTRLTHEYGYGSDVGLEKDYLSVGFAGADFGFLVNLGDVQLEDVGPDHPAAQFLSAFNSPSLEPEARQQQRRAAQGFTLDDFAYSNRLQARVNTLYLLRSVNYGASDVLIAFRVVRKDRDGSVTLLWKVLKKFPAPQLAQHGPNQP